MNGDATPSKTHLPVSVYIVCSPVVCTCTTGNRDLCDGHYGHEKSEYNNIIRVASFGYIIKSTRVYTVGTYKFIFRIKDILWCVYLLLFYRSREIRHFARNPSDHFRLVPPPMSEHLYSRRQAWQYIGQCTYNYTDYI